MVNPQISKNGELFAELKSKIAEHEKLFKIKDIFDDALLAAFLRGKKFNVDDTLKLKNNIPTRLAAVHLMNVGAIGRLLVAFTLRYLKAKVRSRIFVHADFASLHEHVPASELPVSLGGHLSEEDAYESDFVPRIRSQQRFYTKIAQLARHS
ncbi:uncharacterized protein LOC110857054 isoform X2 [Folsomia candida]|uniref:uncharacterized protein LOC110857054 isoform X2 n=1 Tax=Folsomia candida TaxID=158441 RepID=UPI00160550C2|nr:uncharacterized protein LOC110857054 isoform X2 [Folsomia candida]